MKKYAAVIIGIFFLVALSYASAQWELLHGELVLKTDGIYTHVYSYTHRETGKEVVLIGTIHNAEKVYFEHLQKILDSCEYVIFETRDQASELELTRREAESRKNLFGSSIDSAFWYALLHYPSRISLGSLGLIHESVAFDYAKLTWVVGDALWYAEQEHTKWQLFYEKYAVFMAVVPLEIKQEVVTAVRTFVRKVDLGTATKPDVINLLIVPPFGTHDRDLTPLALDLLGRERDEATLRSLDQILRSKNPERVCIKFGAGHMLHQRKLLEQRDYLLKHIWEYRAITLP